MTSDSETAQDEADEIGPVAHGRWAFGPKWYCGDCMDRMEQVGVENAE